MKLQDARSNAKRVKRAGGFTLIEMMLASAILLVGIASVVQLVPASLKSNMYNRMDTTAVTIAQHYLDQMLAQPLSTYSFQVANQDPNQPPITISLGDQSHPDTAVGSPVIMQGSMASIDFTNAVAGYSLNYKDPNDPTGASFDVRWAVIPVMSNGVIVSRRIIIGCRQTNAAQLMLPVNLDTSVQK